ncbi:MAG: bifunctional salicylyl-CoA 5-hydroxylase/oxidoreductase [Sterolibacterium sp.]|nr:bifunctional salicylyl-CoA 5-hydroxylase/oxidoreductase [Sterolibacterium sp.]MBP9800267.1 bifunctional salicylyl-CoA 5-hydroxylase/oxidoreductase [Sterolibacterium sp.]
MAIHCLGGGPAGLYFAIRMKQARPACDITVYEQHLPDDTYGWGIVLPAALLDTLAQLDPSGHAELRAALQHWHACTIHHQGQRIVCAGHDYYGIARHRLLELLRQRADRLGVHLLYGQAVSADVLRQSSTRNGQASDLIVAADGSNSGTRTQHAQYFQPEIHTGKTRYLWLGAPLKFDSFTFITLPTVWGCFQAHVYPFDEANSTFIVECHENTWRAAGLDQLDASASADFCSQLFADFLQGAALRCNKSPPRGAVWPGFQQIRCQQWHYDNIVLLGDAAHTQHFSIGAGTRLALEDALALSHHLAEEGVLENPVRRSQALQRYQEERQQEMLRLLNAARNRMEWFEHIDRHQHLESGQFAYALLTSSQRVGHASLQQRDPGYIDGVERQVAARAGIDKPAGQRLLPMFTPCRLGGLTLINRVVVSPMALYACDDQDGLPGDFHLAHLGSRALGGAALIMTEMTAVTPQARITPYCAGLWNDQQQAAWQRIVRFVHQASAAKIGLQLGHAGPKGSTQPGWQYSDEPLPDGNWPLLAASALPYGPQNQTPRAMTQTDMAEVLTAFVAAARRAAAAGFDLLELHCAHGYLLSSFLCPLTNQRSDEYGGSLENRLRYPLAVCRALRAVWPAERPLAVRISAVDWAPGGNTLEDAVIMARAFQSAGVTLIDVSSGQTTRAARPIYGRMYQTPFAERIRSETGMATMAVGNIHDPDHVNTIIAAGRADLCAIGRPHLADPAWTLHAAAAQGYTALEWPRPYRAAKHPWEQQALRTHA